MKSAHRFKNKYTIVTNKCKQKKTAGELMDSVGKNMVNMPKNPDQLVLLTDMNAGRSVSVF